MPVVAKKTTTKNTCKLPTEFLKTILQFYIVTIKPLLSLRYTCVFLCLYLKVQSLKNIILLFF